MRGLSANVPRIAIAALTAVYLFGAFNVTYVCAEDFNFVSHDTHSHLVINIDPDVTYQVEPIEKNKKLTGLRLTLKNYALKHLPTKLRDLRTESVRASQAGDNTVYEISFSDQATRQGIEYFDFRNKTPAQLVLDYWIKSAATSREIAKATSSKAKLPVLKKNAGHKNNFSYEPCSEKIQLGNDGFVLWKIYHKPFDYRAYFKLSPTADVGYKYPDEAKNPKELAHYRLAFNLYKESQYALVLRTIEFFNSQYPTSKLGIELEFLKASTLIQLSRMLRTDRYYGQAMEIYRTILLQGPDTKRGLAALEFLLQDHMASGHSAMALEYALMGAEQAERAKNTALLSVFRLATAEALFGMKEYDRAERAYQAVIDAENELSPEGAFRMAENYSAKKFWERSVYGFEKAIKNFPKAAGRFPSAWLNLAEAYFRLGKFADSKRVYAAYVERFPSDDMVWAGKLRLAELDQMGQGPQKFARAVFGRYEAIVNEHPYTPGEMLSHLRLAACYRAETKDQDRERFYREFFENHQIEKFESPLVDRDQVTQWFDLEQARFDVAHKNFTSALRKSEDYRHRLAQVELGSSFKKAYEDAVSGLCSELAKEDDPRALLETVAKYGDLAPRPETLSYLLAIAKAEQETGKVAKVTETIHDLERRLEQMNDDEKDLFHLIKARSLKQANQAPTSVIAELSRIRDKGDYAHVKYDELAQAAYGSADFRSALNYDSQLLETKLGKDLDPEWAIEASVRELRSASHVYTKNPEEIVKLADRALFRYGAYTEYGPSLCQVREIRALALYDSHQWKNSIEAFQEILNNLTDAQAARRTEFEFKVAKALSQLGRETEAFEAFRGLAQAGSGEDVWKKQAAAELEQLQWEKEVNKQLNDRRSK